MSPSPAAEPAPRVEQFETLVIGGGQAGLATGYHLARHDADFAILDAHDAIGASWRQRWDSLRLFTPARHNNLPGLPFPAPPTHFPDKDEVADYLARYAERFDLPVRFGTRVLEVTRHGAHFDVRTSRGTMRARQLVVASGTCARPAIPAWAESLDPAITQLTSTTYRNPFALPDGPVLVVGAGNSGAQIALELARHRKVWLAGRDTGMLPRQLLGRDIFDWISPIIRHVPLDGRLGDRLRPGLRGGDALVGLSSRDLQAAGVERVPRATGVADGMPRCETQVLEPRTIIWCTGLRPAHDWLPAIARDEEGRPRHQGGRSTTLPGLRFVGLRHQRRLASSLLGGVGADAAHAVAELQREAGG